MIKSPLRDVYPDSNSGRSTNAPGGKTDYDYIRESGLIPNKRPTGNPPLRDRFNAVNAMLKPSSGRIRMTISPRCRGLIKYHLLYSHEFRNRDSQKKMGHLLDARDYPVCWLFPSDREGLKLRNITGV